MMKELAHRIDQRTPPARDRYFDFLRVTSILFVVIGHWTVRVVTVENEQIQTHHLLNIEPWTQWATLVFQVMPIFFIVGALMNAASWRRAMKSGVSRTDWVRKRARRLLRPMAVLLLALIPAAALISAWWGDAIVFGLDDAVVPLWFLAAYLVLTALTPQILWLHERLGGLRLFAAMCLLAVIIDMFSLKGFTETFMPIDLPYLEPVNTLVVWPGIYLLGFLWADSQLPERAATQALLAGAGLLALVLMIGSGLYPVSFIPIEAGQNNGMPPSSALLALACVQLGILLLARGPVTRLLRRPVPWALVAIPGGSIITIFLWHQTAMAAVAALIYPTGLWSAMPEITATWWALRPAWLLACAAVLVVFVLVFGRFEGASEQLPSRFSGRAAAISDTLGIVLVTVALLLLITGGLSDPDSPLHLPVLPVLLLFSGLVVLGVVGQKFTTREDRT